MYKKIIFILVTVIILGSLNYYSKHSEPVQSSLLHDSDPVVVTQITNNVFSIIPKRKDVNIMDMDMESSSDKALFTSIFNVILKLSKDNENADFQFHITQDTKIQITVTLYSSKNPDSPKKCCFCERKFNGAILGEDHTTIAFEKRKQPKNPINFLIIPKKHLVNYKDPLFTVDIFIQQMKMAQKCALKLINRPRFELHVNNGSGAGQTVFHSHMHFMTNGVWKQRINTHEQSTRRLIHNLNFN